VEKLLNKEEHIVLVLKAIRAGKMDLPLIRKHTKLNTSEIIAALDATSGRSGENREGETWCYFGAESSNAMVGAAKGI